MKEDLERLAKGVKIKVGKKYYQTRPSSAQLLEKEPNVQERNPPIRFRKSIPTSWVQLTLTEGKNRQVRKMCAKIGFPVLRLIRISIEDLNFQNMNIGEVQEMKKQKLAKLLNIKLY